MPQLVLEVQPQLASGALQRQNFAAAASKEYHEQARLLNDREFLRSNVRVQAGAAAEAMLNAWDDVKATLSLFKKDGSSV